MKHTEITGQPVVRIQYPLVGVTLAALVLLTAGCDRDNVKVYHVEKEDAVAVAYVAPAADAGALPTQAPEAMPQLKWILPDGWQETTPGQMRVASFTVTSAIGQTADVAVIPLPTTGQEIQLVNMWREQMKLPATTNADVGTETVTVGDAPGKLFDIASHELLIEGKSRARILVAMLPRGGTSWFFKMTGEDAFVVAQKPTFVQFLKSVNFIENTASTTSVPMPEMSQGGQKVLVPKANQVVTDGKPVWTIPAGWQAAPPSQFLLAKFLIADADGRQAQVNINSLTGDGGGLAANANRWRGQLGLPPMTDILTTSFEVPGGQASVVDFTGTDVKTGKPARLIGVALPLAGQTWFYKLMGDEQVVAQQKDALTVFIQSAQYPDVH